MNSIQWKGGNDRVSPVCLGTMYFGSRIDKETSFGILDRYIESGGNFLDTANNYVFWLKGYSPDSSETLLAQYFAERKNRDDLFLATKLGARPVMRPDGTEGWEGASAHAIEAAIEGSLGRLKTDHVDLLYIHVDDRNVPLDESLTALDKLVTAGKVRYIGISNSTPWRFAEAKTISRLKDLASFSAVQNFYSYLRERSDQVGTWISPEFTDLAKTYGDVNLLAYGPLLKGAYARGAFQPWDDQEKRFSTADNRARLATLNACAKRLGVSANQLVLAYVMHTDPGVIPVFSASSLEQLNDSLGVFDLDWTAELSDELKNAGA